MAKPSSTGQRPRGRMAGWRALAVALTAGALVLAGCGVERVTPVETAADETPDPATPDEAADGDANANANTNANANANANQGPQPIAFGMPGFPSGSDLTEGKIREILLAACGTAELCVELVVQTEPSDTVDEGDVIRTDPPRDARVRAGDTVTVVRSSGPAITTDDDGTDEPATGTASETEPAAGDTATPPADDGS